MSIKKEDLFFSEKDFSDKKEWQEYPDHILAEEEKSAQDRRTAQNAAAQSRQTD